MNGLHDRINMLLMVFQIVWPNNNIVYIHMTELSNIFSIWCWWIGGAFFKPMGITTHLYRPKGVGHIQLRPDFPFPQLAKMSLTWGKGWTSKTVLEFKIWYLLTQWGISNLSAFGTMKAGEVCSEFDGHIPLASRCCWIRRAQASLYFCGVLYDQLVIILVGSFNLIQA